MKTIVAISLVASQFLLACKNAEVAVQKEDMPVSFQDVVKETQEKPKQQASISLEKVIGNKNYDVLAHTDSIEISNIHSVLIDGTQNEYGRKIELIKELNIEDGKLLKSIKNNENYIEVMDAHVPFNPSLQFQLKFKDHHLVLLFDEKNEFLGFTSVQGQTILKIAEPLKKELTAISNN